MSADIESACHNMKLSYDSGYCYNNWIALVLILSRDTYVQYILSQSFYAGFIR